MMQLDQNLINLFHENDKIIHDESNGTRKPVPGIDFLTISPKIRWIVREGNELKVVYQGQDLEQYKNSFFNYYFLQPCSQMNIKETIAKIKEDPVWRLSLQTQKMIAIR